MGSWQRKKQWFVLRAKSRSSSLQAGSLQDSNQRLLHTVGRFQGLVDSKVDVAKVETLSYLSLFLKAHLVSSQLVTDANYDIARRMSEERYNYKRSNEEALLAAIHALPDVKKESKVKLRKFL